MRFPSLTTAAGCLLCLVAGCTAEYPLAAPGRSTAPRRGPPGTELSTAQPNPVIWRHFAESRDWPVVASFATQGHPGQAPWAEIRVSPAHAESYRELTRGQQLPEEMAVLLSFSQKSGSPVLRHFSAQKRQSEWEYRILSAAGAVIPADTTLCQRCHAEGRSDGLFGIPSVPSLPPGPSNLSRTQATTPK